MTSIVIDASTAAKWQLSAEPEADRARDMLQDYAAGKIAFVAPKVWHYEIANIFNKAIGTRRITEGEGREAFTLLQALGIEFFDWSSPADAYQLARTYRRSVYDSLYLAAAESRQLAFWTGDRKLYNGVKDRLAFVRWVGDYPPLVQP